MLVVDDEPHTLLATMRLLMREAAHVDGVASGREAFMLCRKRHFDIIVTVLRLPDTSGDVLIRAIRAVSSQTRIVVITGQREPLLTRAREAGADMIFSKPTEWPRVLAYLRNPPRAA